MGYILSNAWALLLGMLFLQIGNGLQGSVIGVRGGLEGFSAVALSYVMSGYFIGFLIGARVAPELIKRVGHVRVFAALAATVSAALILYAAIPQLWFWFLLRILIGFGFSGIYVVAESWLNDAASNETRGQALSVYVIVQMLGIVLAQWVLTLSDPRSYELFVVMTVLVSMSVVPILLSISPVPQFQTTQPMPLMRLWRVSPLGLFGMFCLGGVFSAMFTMAAVYASETGLSIGQLSSFVASFYVGGLL